MIIRTSIFYFNRWQRPDKLIALKLSIQMNGRSGNTFIFEETNANYIVVMNRRYGPKVRFLSSRIMCYSFQCRILITARSAWHWHTRWHLRYPRCELQWLLFSGCDAVKSVRTVPTFRSVLLHPTQCIIIIITGTTWLQGGQIPPPQYFFYQRNILGYWVEEGQIQKLGWEWGKGVYVY